MSDAASQAGSANGATQEQQNRDEHVARAKEAGWTNTDFSGTDQYFGDAARYEWRDEYGDVAPRVPELEAILFGQDITAREGDHMENMIIPVTMEGPTRIKPINSFEDAGMHPVILENIKLAGYERPTPIQCYAIPAALMGHDVIAISQTGSGKTLAYLIPVLSPLMGKGKKLRGPRPDLSLGYNPRNAVRAEPLVIIVVPTRELAIQIFDDCRRLCYRSMLRPCVAYGGYPMKSQIEDLGKGCDILIATPGRLVALMGKPEVLTMSRVKYTIIDEADEMLDNDWDEEMKIIMTGGDSNEDADHIYMMFSATFNKAARSIAKEYMAEDSVRIRVGRPGQSHKNISQHVVFVDGGKKRDACLDFLMNIEEKGRTLIFCNSKPGVDLLDDFLFNKGGLPVTSIHSDRPQIEREDSIRAFRKGACPILVATGVSARGLDIKDIKYVINYDLPSADYGGIKEYVHRIGRTGRIGNKGLATSFYTERDEGIAQDLVNVLVECECEVPEFLSHLQPQEGEAVDWDDNSEDEEAAEEGDGAAEGTAEAEDGW
ncbi:unnamed protein product [Zymoseptoria tritici ST99CH_1A5]|uniref:RNA helicase n=2 Tax=Zymoseptoria tritici TaxID=1047171 RepID=F9XPV4_ZYMTI|nr:uncharacterized protein MYCGRDRAFT_97328 [Zymoseptoria tritici IPO323]EGP82766.1 hypothetical protein MYCGRDRAFT_97328 [Zymoseptoria tritici IPO323]SMR64460.1 unnamed protein product [Zymoseptoria tritici ST99CH_3D1]SMY29803.1 unnamed protein product [Zymoseptoria tritici ST99CH_1A5]